MPLLANFAKIKLQNTRPPDVVLILPDLCSFRSVQRDGNCLFMYFHTYAVTGSEAQHMEVCEGMTSNMLSIENLSVGYDSTGHINYLVPFNFNSVQEYSDNTNMAISCTWGTDLEMICFCHMFNAVMMQAAKLGPFSVQSTLRQVCPKCTTS